MMLDVAYGTRKPSSILAEHLPMVIDLNCFETD